MAAASVEKVASGEEKAPMPENSPAPEKIPVPVHVAATSDGGVGVRNRVALYHQPAATIKSFLPLHHPATLTILKRENVGGVRVRVE